MQARISRTLALLFLLCLFSPVQAQPEARISDLGGLDKQYMAQQRAIVEDIARRSFGRGFNRQPDNDLALLQGILDRQLIRPDQTRELQAMGVVLGDLLGEQLDMHWVVYEDRAGRSRALRYQQTDTYLYPVTMISRRVEVGNRRPVAEIYQKAYDIVDPLRPRMPFE